jgi:hypothetical protein
MRNDEMRHHADERAMTQMRKSGSADICDVVFLPLRHYVFPSALLICEITLSFPRNRDFHD